MQRNNQGIGLIAAVALLAVLALSIGLLAPAVYEVTVSDKTANIGNDLQSVKLAITGNPSLIVNGGRSDYGYVGTMGNPPSKLSDMWIQGSQPSYQFNTTVKVGGGWVGPYIPSSFVEDLLALDKDRFGNPFIFTSTPFTRSSDGQTVAIRIQSVGPDGIADTSDDQIADVLQGEVYATVTGTLKQGTKPVKFAGVSLNYPNNGVVTSASDSTDANGIFVFNNISFGFRSVSVSPLLLYKDGTATDNKDGGSTLSFTVTNAATNDSTITSMSVDWDPGSFTGYYEQLSFAGKTVFDYTWAQNSNTRAGRGQTITFKNSSNAAQPIVVKGSGRPSQVIPIRVDQQVETTPDLLIKSLGQSVSVSINKFKAAATGSPASSPIPSGLTFTIMMSDGSTNVITAP